MRWRAELPKTDDMVALGGTEDRGSTGSGWPGWSASELVPVPTGLRATVEEPEDLPLGSGMSERRITVTGTDGQSESDVHEQVRRHLAGRGWDLDQNGQACRPNGRLLDRRDKCVSVSTYEGAVHVRYEGWRAWP